jgi:hypothetical protein
MVVMEAPIELLRRGGGLGPSVGLCVCRLERASSSPVKLSEDMTRSPS